MTAIAVSPFCPNPCKLLLGAAGGGVWLAQNALGQNPSWTSVNNGIGSNAIVSLAFDPNDARGETAYAGTGEGNGSSDSEAGVGLYKTVDLGMHWTLVPGSVAVANGRSIAAIAVDPTNANHIYIGTAVARHGAASVNGGRFTPPGALTIGLYESKDGGATFTLAFSVPSDTVDPTTPSGNDFFRGGITRIVLDRTGLNSGPATRVFLSVFDYGVYRSLDGITYTQIFTSPSNGSIPFSSVSRTQFAITPRNGTVRMYVGDSGNSTGTGVVYRSDDVLTAAPSFTLLSSPTAGTPGHATYNFCEGQCWYDMWIEASSTNPDEVWVAGSMEYGELNPHSPSNGRAVVRSTDGGVHFADMTDDAASAPMWLHPDQHYVALVPSVPGVAFIGTDGGLYRTNGVFVDTTSQCASRGVTGADLTDCQMWLSAIPQRLINMNVGLDTLQFQSVSVGNDDPINDLLGGTQDNGTLANRKNPAKMFWAETINGDGGQSGIDITNATRMHTFTGPSPDVNFFGNQTLHWNWTGDPLFASGEAASFYVPLINDPVVSGSWFIGLQRVWRTQDNGGAQTYLAVHCDEFTGDFSVPCGDWERWEVAR